MIPIKHIDPDDLALYAMQLLPPDEMEEMRKNLQYSVEARKVLSEYTSDLAIFAHTAEMHSPPAQARQRLMKHVAREKKVLPPTPLPQAAADAYAPRESASLLEMERAPRSTGARIFTWAGWALAAAMLIGVANFFPEYQQLKSRVASDQTKLAKAQETTELLNMALGTSVDDAVHARLTSTGTPPPASGRATYVPAKGALIFVASNLEPVDPAKTYELWVVPKTGGDPIPAGTFKPDSNGNASVVMPELPKNVEAAAFAVTIEDAGGSRTPTKPLILQGTAS